MLFHCFLWVHSWASKEEENKREIRKTKHTQKLQQVGTNSTSSMVSSVHSEMAGWGFFLLFFNIFFSDSTLTVHKRQETKHSQQQLSFFFPFIFGVFLFSAQTNLNTWKTTQATTAICFLPVSCRQRGNEEHLWNQHNPLPCPSPPSSPSQSWWNLWLAIPSLQVSLYPVSPTVYVNSFCTIKSSKEFFGDKFSQSCCNITFL